MIEPMISSSIFDLVVFVFVATCVILALVGLIYGAIFSRDPKRDDHVLHDPNTRYDFDQYLQVNERLNRTMKSDLLNKRFK